MTGRVADVQAMNRAIALHGLRPVVDATFPFERVCDARRHLEGAKHFGETVIRI